MCSILGIFDVHDVPGAIRPLALQLSRRQRHRGPDSGGVYQTGTAILARERLAIVDTVHGQQPLYSSDGTSVLIVNGEIYNHRDLRQGLANPYSFQTESDSEIILAL